MATQVILLEKITKLGEMGEVVSVKPGYARNYLLPQNKALRATEDNIAYFESQKTALQKLSDEKKADAEKVAKKLKGLKVALIRQASEGGQLYGSVTGRDIAEATAAISGEKVERSMVEVNQNFKMLGLYPVEVQLHPEVVVEVTVNIARTEDEAKIQEKTGKAVIAEDEAPQMTTPTVTEEQDTRAELMDEKALAAEQAREAEEAAEAEEDAAKAAEKSAARAEKKAAKAAEEEAAAEAEAEASTEETEEEKE